MFVQQFNFWPKNRLLRKISIFDQKIYLNKNIDVWFLVLFITNGSLRVNCHFGLINAVVCFTIFLQPRYMYHFLIMNPDSRISWSNLGFTFLISFWFGNIIPALNLVTYQPIRNQICKKMWGATQNDCLFFVAL